MNIQNTIDRINKAISKMDEQTKYYVNEGIRTEEIPTIRQFVEHHAQANRDEIDTIMETLEDVTHYANNQIK